MIVRIAGLLLLSAVLLAQEPPFGPPPPSGTVPRHGDDVVLTVAGAPRF